MFSEKQVLKLLELPNTRPEVRQNIVKYIKALQTLQDQDVKKTTAQLATVAKLKNARTFQRLLEEADWDDGAVWNEHARILKPNDVKRPQATVHIHQQQIRTRAKYGTQVLNIAILCFKTEALILKCSLEIKEDLIHWAKQQGFRNQSVISGTNQERIKELVQQMIHFGITDIQARSDKAWSRHTLLCVLGAAIKSVNLQIKPKEIPVKRKYERVISADEHLKLDIQNAERLNPEFGRKLRETVQNSSDVAQMGSSEMMDAFGGFNNFLKWVLIFKLSNDPTLPPGVGFPGVALELGLVDEHGRGTKKAVKTVALLLEMAREMGVLL